MQQLFHPVRRLLPQFGQPWVVIASGLVLAGLVAGIAYLNLDRANSQIRASERQVDGLITLARIRAVLEPLQVRRGLAGATLNGDTDLAARVDTCTARVDAAFAALMRQRDALPALAAGFDQAHALWRALDNAAADGASFDRYSALIDRLLELARRVIDESGLILDSGGDIYHLIGAMDVMLSFSLERSAQLRGLYTAMLASGGADMHRRGELLVCASALDEERKLIDHHVAAAIRYRPALAAQLKDLPARLGAATTALHRLMREYVLAPGAELESAAFFDQASGAIQSGYALFDRALALTDAALRARLARERTERGWTAAGLLALSLGIAYLFVGVLSNVRAWRSERDFIDAVLDTVGAIVIVMARDGRVVRFNRACERVTGYRADEVVGGFYWEKLIPRDEITRIGFTFEELTAGHFPNSQENHWRTRAGDSRLIAWSNTCIADSGGRVQYVIATGIDITEARAAEAELRLAAKVFEHAGEAIMVTDAENRIVKVNPAFSAITGYPAAAVRGLTPAQFKSGRHDAAFYQAMWQSLAEAGTWQGEIWDRRRDGTVYPLWLTISAIRDYQGALGHYVALFTDISERKRQEERIHHMALHDALTGLPNRILFRERLRHAINVGRREGSRLSVTFIDLDGFKTVNDSLGHDVGDLVLEEVASRIRTHLRREVDMVARLGGDEFVVLMERLTEPAHCARLAEEIIADIARPLDIQGHVIQLGASMGMAFFPEDGSDGPELMKRADVAMYAAKAAGKGTYRFFQASMLEAVSQQPAGDAKPAEPGT